MAMSYMEMIFIDGNDARHTNVRAAMETNALTWAAFKSYRRLEAPKDRAVFLLDYYNAKGDLADTILLDAATYTKIANEPVLSAEAYRKIDRDYWHKAQSEYRAKQQAREPDMKIDRYTFQHRNDFAAVYECEHCGHKEERSGGYNDAFYHERVIPAMHCGGCGKDRAGNVLKPAAA